MFIVNKKQKVLRPAETVDMGKQSGIVFHTFDITDLAKGTYFVQMRSDAITFSKTFIKQ